MPPKQVAIAGLLPIGDLLFKILVEAIASAGRLEPERCYVVEMFPHCPGRNGEISRHVPGVADHLPSPGLIQYPIFGSQGTEKRLSLPRIFGRFVRAESAQRPLSSLLGEVKHDRSI
jgi:hypothetical protein